MGIIEILFGVVIALVGAFLFQKNRANNAEAILENNDTKEKLNEVDKGIAKNDGLLAAEEEKRKELEKEAEEEKVKELKEDELLEFLNDDKNRTSH